MSTCAFGACVGLTVNPNPRPAKCHRKFYIRPFSFVTLYRVTWLSKVNMTSWMWSPYKFGWYVGVDMLLISQVISRDNEVDRSTFCSNLFPTSYLLPMDYFKREDVHMASWYKNKYWDMSIFLKFWMGFVMFMIFQRLFLSPWTFLWAVFHGLGFNILSLT